MALCDAFTGKLKVPAGQFPSPAVIFFAGHAMSDELKVTVRIQRPAKIQADSSDQSTCAAAVETIDFELFSTAAVKKFSRRRTKQQ